MRVDPAIIKGTFVDLLKIKFLEIGPDFAQAELELRPDLMQPWGLLHGGVLMSLADTIASAGLVRSLEEGYGFSTIELKMNFIRAVKGGKVIARARCLHTGKSTSVWEVDINDDKNNLVAKATTSFMILATNKTGNRE